MLPRPPASVIRTALGGRGGFPAITGSHQLSHVIVSAPVSPGRSAGGAGGGYVVSGKFAGVGGIRRCTCAGPPFFTSRTRGRPARRHVRLPALRSVTSAIPPSRLGTNVTCPCAFRSAAAHAAAAGARFATCDGCLDVQGTTGPSAPALLFFELELQPAARASGSRTEAIRMRARTSAE